MDKHERILYVMKILMYIVFMAFLCTTAVSMRYKVVSQSTDTDIPLVMVYDTWTGEMSITTHEMLADNLMDHIMTFYYRTK